MSSTNKDSVASSFPFWIPFISSSCLIAMARTSSTMVNETGESRHLCLVPDLKGNTFTFSFPIWMPFISSSCLIAMARTCTIMFNKRGENRHLFLVPIPKGNALSFCPLSMMLTVVCHIYMAFIMFRYIPSRPTLLRVFIIN